MDIITLVLSLVLLQPVLGSTHSVSGGSFSQPFYTFSPALPSTFVAGTSYTFTAAGISGSHPFRVGTAFGVTPSWVTASTGGISSSSGTITMAVPSDYTGSIVCYCSLHSSMIIYKSVTGGVVVSSPPPPSPLPSPPPSPATCIEGYWPLYDNEADAVAESPGGTAHTHAFNVVWWMPDGFEGALHTGDEADCPIGSTLLSPSPPPMSPPSASTDEDMLPWAIGVIIVSVVVLVALGAAMLTVVFASQGRAVAAAGTRGGTNPSFAKL